MYLEWASEMVDFLQENYSDRSNPTYYFKEIDCKQLDIARASSTLQKYPAIDGSAKFQVVVFNPHSNVLKAAPRICVRLDCLQDFFLWIFFLGYKLHDRGMTKKFSHKHGHPRKLYK